ncbi:hypothetical protein PV326_001779, partial [Microctonus aethiopoides]
MDAKKSLGIGKRNNGSKLRKINQRKLLYNTLYWRTMFANFYSVVEELGLERGRWFSRARNINSARARLVTELRRDMEEFEEVLMTARAGLDDDRSSDSSEVRVKEDMNMEEGVLEEKERRWREATRLCEELGDSSLEGDFYFDYVGILWMLQG